MNNASPRTAQALEPGALRAVRKPTTAVVGSR